MEDIKNTCRYLLHNRESEKTMCSTVDPDLEINSIQGNVLCHNFNQRQRQRYYSVAEAANEIPVPLPLIFHACSSNFNLLVFSNKL
jgi:hypothetical protein